jgi:hypothetical protein
MFFNPLSIFVLFQIKQEHPMALKNNVMSSGFFLTHSFFFFRRRRKRHYEQKEGTPLLDETANNGGLEEGEIGNETPSSGPPSAGLWPPSYGPPPSRLPPPSRAAVPVVGIPPPVPFVDTSVPPPILGGGAFIPPPSLHQPPPSAIYPPPSATATGRYDAYSAAVSASYPPLVPPAPPPPVPILNPELGGYGVRPVGPMGDHAAVDKYGRREESYSRDRDR